MSNDRCEEYDLEQMLVTQELCRICFRTLGLTWQRDRVLAFLAKVGDRIGERVANQYALPFLYYRQLAITLGQLVLDDPSLAILDRWGVLIPYYYQTLVDTRTEERERAKTNSLIEGLKNERP